MSEQYPELRQLPLKILAYDYIERLPQWQFDQPIMNCWRLYWHPLPGVKLHFENETTSLYPDKCVIIPPLTPVSASIDRQVEHMFIHFSCGNFFDSYKPGIYSYKLGYGLGEKFNRLQTLLQITEDDDQFEVLTAIYSIICDVLAKLNKHYVDQPTVDTRIQKAISIINKNKHNNLSNNDLANKLEMSPNYFINYFKQVTGETPQAYILRLKLEAVADKLRTSKDSIEDISDECGFCNRHYMTRQFTKRFNIGPAKYRKRSHLLND